jgi:hypothetical protein
MRTALAHSAYALAGPQEPGERALEPRLVAHHPVDRKQIAAAVRRVGMAEGQRIEEFGFADSFHLGPVSVQSGVARPP